MFCFVHTRYTAINEIANTARYRASSPEVTAIFLVNMPSVPKIAIEAIIMALAFLCLVMVVSVDVFISAPCYKNIKNLLSINFIIYLGDCEVNVEKSCGNQKNEIKTSNLLIIMT